MPSDSKILAVLLLLWPVVPVMAQGVGSIAGTVTDASGAVVPNVTVTLTNPQGSLGGNQTTVTSERGAYQFLRLVPGTYVVKADLTGFRPAEVQNVVVDADVTARADLSLVLGGVEQGLTVTAETQLLDTASVQTQTVMTRAELENLPNRSDAWSALKIIPGAILANQTIDVGGSQGFQQQAVTVRGNNATNTFAIDGMDVSAATQTLAIIYLDPVSFQETSFQVAAAGAETSSGGMTFNAVTRTGTNQWHGGVGSPGSTLGSHWASAQNFSTQQRADVLATVPAAVLKANPNLSPNNNILMFNDFNAWIAGPVIKNKLWVAGSWRDQRYDILTLGAYNLNGSELRQNNILRNTTVKIAYQLTKSSQLTYFNNVQYKVNAACGQSCGGQTFTDNLAQGYKSKTPDVNQVKYTGSFGPRFVLDAGYSRLRLHDQTGTEPGVALGAMSNYDLVTLTRTNALASYGDNSQDRDVVKASGSFITARHNLRFGLDYDKAMTHARSWATSNIVAQFRNGVPDSVVTSIIAVTKSTTWNAPDVPSWTYNISTTTAFYVQDKYSVTRRLVANLGLRYEMNHGHQDAACMPTTQFFTANQCYPAVNAPSPRTFLPRVGLIYDLTGKGKTALKVGFNRYSMPFTTSQMSLVKSMLSIGVVTNTRTWTDLNGDGIPQLNELGPDPGYSLPQLATNPFVGNILWPYFDEYTAEVEQQLPQQIVASVLYSRRLNRDNIGTENSSIPTSAYTPLTVTEKTTGKVVQVWLRDPSYAHAPTTNVQFNTPLLNTEFSGLEIKLNKRLSNHFSLLGGASFQRTVAHSSGGDLNNPSNRLFDSGVTVGSIPWSYRFSGAYQAPHGVLVSSTFQYDKGLGEMTTVQVGSNTIAFNPGQATTQTVNFAKRAAFLPNVVQLDSSVQKPWHLTERQTISARMDFYNAMNNATVTSWVTQLGPTYHRISGIQAGRMMKLGLNYQF
jgi:hypothetical protein